MVLIEGPGTLTFFGLTFSMTLKRYDNGVRESNSTTTVRRFWFEKIELSMHETQVLAHRNKLRRKINIDPSQSENLALSQTCCDGQEKGDVVAVILSSVQETIHVLDVPYLYIDFLRSRWID